MIETVYIIEALEDDGAHVYRRIVTGRKSREAADEFVAEAASEAEALAKRWEDAMQRYRTEDAAFPRDNAEYASTADPALEPHDFSTVEYKITAVAIQP